MTLGNLHFPGRLRLGRFPLYQCPGSGTLGKPSWEENMFPGGDDTFPHGKPTKKLQERREAGILLSQGERSVAMNLHSAIRK